MKVLSASVLALLALPFAAASESVRGTNHVARKMQGYGPKAKLEFWFSPKDDWDSSDGSLEGPNVAAVRILRNVARAFGPNVEFDMNQYINSGDGVCPKEDENGAPLEHDAFLEVCNDSCINERRYCEAPPTDDIHKDIKPAHLVEEALRRQCIWSTVPEARKFFDYVIYYSDRHCHNKKFDDKWDDCIAGTVVGAPGIDPQALDACIEQSGGFTSNNDNKVLDAQIQRQQREHIDALPSLPAILINNQAVQGEITENNVFLLLCNALPEEARFASCKDILKEAAQEEPTPENEEELTDEIEEDIDQIVGDEGEQQEELEMEEEAKEEEEEEEGEEELGDEAMEALEEKEEVQMEKEEEGVNSLPSDSSTMEEKSAEESEMQETPEAGEKPTMPPFNILAETSAPKVEELNSVVQDLNSFAEGREQEGETTEEEVNEQEGKAPETEEEYDTELEEEFDETEGEFETEEEFEEAAEEFEAEEEELDALPEEASIDSLDLSLVDMEIAHWEALKTCEVNAEQLMTKILALGATDGKLSQEEEDVEEDLPLLMTQNCPHDEGLEIMHRLRDFHGCAMFDLQELIETFPSTAVGVAMRCATAYSNMTKEEAEKGFIPEDCVRTVEASSVLGRGIFGLYLYPDVACPCFEKLGDGIPECTADVWPIPINGALLRTQSCLVGQYCQNIDSLCGDNMKILNKCLPPRGTKPKDMQCEETFDKCAAVYDQVNPMWDSAPLPDACVRIAQGSEFYGTHIVERYDAFRHQCGENIELWEGHSKVGEIKSFVQEGVKGMDYQSIPFVFGAVGGFLAGVVFTILFIIVRNFCICVKNCFRRWCCCGRKKRNQRPTSRDYATIDTKGEEVEGYHD